MKTRVKTIDIQAKEWFDRVNGNSYFAGLITVNFGMDNEQRFKMPFQYGYGSQYEQEAFKVLKEAGLIETVHNSELRDSNIIVRSNIVRGCKQRELKEYN
jgi:hypothetical protein